MWLLQLAIPFGVTVAPVEFNSDEVIVKTKVSPAQKRSVMETIADVMLAGNRN